MQETTNYEWELPEPGGSVGAWGTILNRALEDGVEPVLGELEDDTDATQADVAAIDDRVTALENAGAEQYSARVYLDGAQTIPVDQFSRIEFSEETDDNGGLVGDSGLVIPNGGGGLYEVNAQVTVPFHDVGDRSMPWAMQVRQNGEEIGSPAFVPFMDDGAFEDSLFITLRVSALVIAEPNDRIEVFVNPSRPDTFGGFGGTGTGQVLGNNTGSITFLEALRLVAG